MITFAPEKITTKMKEINSEYYVQDFLNPFTISN